MKTIKVIDLLNMISKGEEVPRKIKFNDEILEFKFRSSTIEELYNNWNGYWLDICNVNLNDEVEILEPQEHKIPEKIEYHQVRRNEVEVDYIEDGIVKHFCLNKKQRYFADKINEILDYLEEIK